MHRCRGTIPFSCQQNTGWIILWKVLFPFHTSFHRKNLRESIVQFQSVSTVFLECWSVSVSVMWVCVCAVFIMPGRLSAELVLFLLALIALVVAFASILSVPALRGGWVPTETMQARSKSVRCSKEPEVSRVVGYSSLIKHREIVRTLDCLRSTCLRAGCMGAVWRFKLSAQEGHSLKGETCCGSFLRLSFPWDMRYDNSTRIVTLRVHSIWRVSEIVLGVYLESLDLGLGRCFANAPRNWVNMIKNNAERGAQNLVSSLVAVMAFFPMSRFSVHTQGLWFGVSQLKTLKYQSPEERQWCCRMQESANGGVWVMSMQHQELKILGLSGLVSLE